MEAEERVRLLEQQVGHRDSETVPVQSVGALGLVLGDVEERLVVRGPGHRADLLHAVGPQRAGFQILHVKRVVAEAGQVGGIGEEPTVVAHRGRAQGQEGVPLGELVQIEHHLLGRLQAAGLATVDRVLLALLGARIVVVAAQAIGHGLVVFLDARQHLGVERFLEGHGGLHHRVGIGVFRGQVGDDLGVVLLPHPVVIVLAHIPVDHVGPGNFPGDRGTGGVKHAPHRTTRPPLARPRARSLH